MIKQITAAITAGALIFGSFSLVFAAPAADPIEISERIADVKKEYEPQKSHFVSDSTQKWVGEDNIAGDKNFGCFVDGTTNSHGRFGNLYQSMGFANYVFYNIYDEIPMFGYHCNPGELNNSVVVIARYASECKYLKGETNGEVSLEAVKDIMSKVLEGDILVVAPSSRCKVKGRAMVVTGITENTISVYQADYNGDCAVTEDVIPADALDDYHCITLLRSAKYPYPDPVPPAAVDGVVLSGNEFSLNESVAVSWNAQKYADKYTAELIDSTGNVIVSNEHTNTTTSFVFSSAGEYTVRIIATNEYGDSLATCSDKITVYPRNIVRFLDHDGSVITTQYVLYGEAAVSPHVPQRTGYQFAGWDKNFDCITSPTDITAVYEIKKYTIKYYDVGGTKALKPEVVEYMGKANPPTNYTVSDGYVFAGWQIGYDSDGTDYNCVDGDMTLIATEKWANLNLPITIEISDAHRDSEGRHYSADLLLKNHDTQNAKNFKIIGSLKGSDGKALKIVVLDEVSLSPGESKHLTDRVIVYSEKATVIEFVAVGIVGNSKTGGAFSKVVSSSISDNTSWGEWTEWTTSNMISSYDAYESRTQWRFRNIQYATSTEGNWTGWEKYHSEFLSYGSTQGPVYYDPSNGARNVWSEQYVTSSNYKQVYHYFRYAKSYYGGYGSVKSDYPNYYEYHFDYELPRSSGSYGHKWQWGSGEDWNTVWELSYLGKPYITSEWVSNNYGTRWYYQEPIYLYYYRMWGEWSGWYDYYPGGDAVEQRTIYRYRNRSDSGESEDTSGEYFSFSGVIENVTADFAGMTASVMVYKKCNTDPTEEQLEYVGETVIGEGNTYSFSFKPKDMPSADTGEFIIALGIEGADRLVNVDVIYADKPKFSVRFFADGKEVFDKNATEIENENGEIVRVQLVSEGEAAIEPDIPEKQGYRFIGWSDTLTAINADTVLNAEYEPLEFSVVFVDTKKDTVELRVLKYGDDIVYPRLKTVEGAFSRVWDKQLEGVLTVTDNIVVMDVTSMNEYQVIFRDGNNDISVQTVKHGAPAQIPEYTPESEGRVFVDWTGDCSYEFITCDSVFLPVFMYEKTVAMPHADIGERDEDGSALVSLYCDTAGSEIYYIIESHNDIELNEDSMYDESKEIFAEKDFKSSATLYTGDFILNENETVTFIAYAEGMNDSMPASESNETGYSYFEIETTINSLRHYRDSVEGDLTLNIINNMPGYENGTVSLCFYDDRGVMLDIIPKNVDIVPGCNKVEFTDLLVESSNVRNSDQITCRIICWLSGESVIPISDVTEFVVK